jgi:hypothetical protein
MALAEQFGGRGQSAGRLRGQVAVRRASVAPVGCGQLEGMIELAGMVFSINVS